MIWIVLICVLFVSIELLDTRMVDQEYNSFFSFNKTLDRKMVHFPDKKVGWLKFYMNIILPIGAAMGAMASYNAYMIDGHSLASTIYSHIFGVTMIINALLFRFVDSSSYVLNIVASLVFLGEVMLPVFWSGPLWGAMLPGMIPWILVVVANLFYFHKKKELFMRTAKELSQKYTLL